MGQQREYSGYIIRDGWKAVIVVGSVAIITLLVTDSFFLKLLMLAIIGGILYIYRNPERFLDTHDKNAITTPSDGKVTSIETINDEFCVEGCYKIVIAKSVGDVSVLRSPLDGTIARLKWQKGMRLPLNYPDSRLLNERTLTVFDNGKSQCLVVHEPASWCSNMNFFYKNGSALQTNWRYGYQIGGNIIIYLPQNSRVALSVGKNVMAGETLVGYFSSSD